MSGVDALMALVDEAYLPLAGRLALRVAIESALQAEYEHGCKDGPPARADGMPASQSERHLRRLLALRAAIPHAYYDDGEAQGCESGISIDFMREPVADIDAKLRALNVARAIARGQAAEPVAARSFECDPGVVLCRKCGYSVCHDMCGAKDYASAHRIGDE